MTTFAPMTHESHHPEEGQRPVQTGRIAVVLLGQVDLAPKARTDARFDVIRVESGFDAIGEVTAITAEGIAQGCAVVLAPGGLALDEERDWVEALRMVSPSLRVIYQGQHNNRAEYDLVTAEDISGSMLLDLLPPNALDGARPVQSEGPDASTPISDRGFPTDEPAEPARALGGVLSEPKPMPTSEDQQGTEAPTPSSGEKHPEGGPRILVLPDDTRIIRAMLSGADAMPILRQAMRNRLNDPEALFLAHSEGVGDDPSGPQHTSGRGIPVEHRGRSFGVILPGEHSPTSEHAVRETATWLAHWLQLIEQQLQLQDAAFRDALTGAWNRRYFDQALPKVLDHARLNRQSLTLMLLDVDDFKRYNDQHGHAAGDEILIEAVRLLRACIRPTDRVCRIGGDELAVIFYDPEGSREAGSNPPSSIFEIARRFQARIGTHEFAKLGAEAVGCLTVSGGLAVYPWDGTDAASLTEAADRLLREGKANGKNAIQFGDGRIC